jgi:hypothetical protein
MKKFLNIKLYKDDVLTNEYKHVNSYYNENVTFTTDNIHSKITDTSFIRENEGYKFNINLIKKTAYFLLKEKDVKLIIKVFESSIKRTKNKIEIMYRTETEEPTTRIIIESE